LAGNLSKNPQKTVIATYTCFLTNFTELILQAYSLWRTALRKLQLPLVALCRCYAFYFLQ